MFLICSFFVPASISRSLRTNLLDQVWSVAMSDQWRKVQLPPTAGETESCSQQAARLLKAARIIPSGLERLGRSYQNSRILPLDRYATIHSRSKFVVVRGNESRKTRLADQRLKGIEDVKCRLRVQVRLASSAKRISGAIGNRACNGHSLLLTPESSAGTVIGTMAIRM